ncbi:hypothetical protein CJ179_48250 [Rhodococcus sp. ACS1]|uniref:hypothetical protein n=1 Tax=Rhodococcus TaxID=1827 RepID=UPI000BB0F20B|nr:MULTISPECIES: hypothetical protein [Rhodococcus]MDI9941382.1 hypothetical protein [Rhodococcus sp. IEGM 1351]MDX5962125.1 hypothetical protein [Rhodococcus opacus]PBC35394.1 hypothetical protein CJ179_48250 [Rhodococcus sp. ACS1]
MSLTETPSNYAAIARQLVSIWDECLEDGSFTVISGGPFDPAKATRVLSLAHHVRRLAVAALDDIDSDGVLVSIPTIRACFECSITAMWIAQSADGVQAWLAQEPATRRAIRASLRKADSPELREVAAKVASIEPLGIESSSGTQADAFAEMTNDLERGRDLYVIYRFLCGFNHASPMLTDQYLALDESPGSNGYEFVPEPEEPDQAPFIHFIACSMLWALSAVRFIQKDRRSLRSQLRTAAQELGAPTEYQLTAQARARQDGLKWGGPKKLTAKDVRSAAKAKGLEYALSPGTATSTPAHHVWAVTDIGTTMATFATIEDAATHIRNHSN